MNATMLNDSQQAERRHKGAVRTAIVLAIMAVGFYVTFFVTRL